jgi:hypothetical protein
MVQFNGNLLVGLKPGDEFEIKIGKKQIRSIPVGASDEED